MMSFSFSILNLSSYSLSAFFIIFFGYIVMSGLLQFLYYKRQGNRQHIWKTQPTAGTPRLNKFFGLPFFSDKPDRAPYHRLLTTFNLIVASSFAAITTEASLRGWTKMRYDGSFAIEVVFIEILWIVVYENVVEYYWHRLMHTSLFYKNFHKFHHFYKSPEPWDDMYIHPLEAIGYYCILYGPPYLFNIDYRSFIVYMIIMGLCGVLDHSGVKFELLGIYNTVDHDNHHAKFEVNYAFPFPYMDILHGTYDGVFFGKKYSYRKLETTRN